ncbi:MAG: exopolysaccharide biosynthesis polyprenyl glycosylphosphotransferase [Pseudobdellovibrionaceae bacterium]
MGFFSKFIINNSKFILLCLDASVLFSLVSKDLGADYNISICLIIPLIITILYIFETYKINSTMNLVTLLKRQVMPLFFGFLCVFIFNYIGPQKNILPLLAQFFVLSIVFRLIFFAWYKNQNRKMKWLVFIADPSFINSIKKDFSAIGLENNLQFCSTTSPAHTIDALLKNSWTGIVIADPKKNIPNNIDEMLIRKNCNGEKILTIAEFYEQHLKKVPVKLITSDWFFSSEGFSSLSNPLLIFSKRLIDILISSVFLVVSLPIQALVFLLIKLESKGPAIYKQVRTGKNGIPFTIYKFRSMALDAEVNGAQWAIKNDPRITKVGSFIRLTRLDELPQLWNVLKGEMSFVGPRPERPNFNEILEKQLPYYDLRHSLKPGITGLAQVLYPYGASVEDSKQKLQFELYYIKHNSILLDFKIILKTIAVVLGARGR